MKRNSDRRTAQIAYMDGTGSELDYSTFLEQYAEQIKEKIKNGETEPAYQIGGQSFTKEEWEKLIEKIDKDIEQIQADQAEVDSVSETQIQELLKDNKEASFATPISKEELLQQWDEQVKSNQDNKMTVYEMLAARPNAENLMYSFVGSSKTMTFDEYVQEVSEMIQDL